MYIPDLKHFDPVQFQEDLQKLIDWNVPLKEEIEHQKEMLKMAEERLEERKKMVEILAKLK